MARNSGDLGSVEQEVLRTLRESETGYSPANLIYSLKQSGLSEDLVRVAVWYLIDRAEVELTDNWVLDLKEPISH